MRNLEVEGYRRDIESIKRKLNNYDNNVKIQKKKNHDSMEMAETGTGKIGDKTLERSENVDNEGLDLVPIKEQINKLEEELQKIKAKRLEEIEEEESEEQQSNKE